MQVPRALMGGLRGSKAGLMCGLRAPSWARLYCHVVRPGATCVCVWLSSSHIGTGPLESIQRRLGDCIRGLHRQNMGEPHSCPLSSKHTRAQSCDGEGVQMVVVGSHVVSVLALDVCHGYIMAALQDLFKCVPSHAPHKPFTTLDLFCCGSTVCTCLVGTIACIAVQYLDIARVKGQAPERAKYHLGEDP